VLCTKGVGDGSVRVEGWRKLGDGRGGGAVEKARLPGKGFRGYEYAHMLYR
jgi:hypothetical protein